MGNFRFTTIAVLVVAVLFIALALQSPAEGSVCSNNLGLCDNETDIACTRRCTQIYGDKMVNATCFMTTPTRPWEYSELICECDYNCYDSDPVETM
ncbi:unnamed protein product [Brassica rapa subsp. trilocularis]